MTNKEILKKAIEKVTEGGYEGCDLTCDRYTEYGEYYHVIFSHDFAKAFWKRSHEREVSDFLSISGWQYRLQQMVLEEEPLKYIERAL